METRANYYLFWVSVHLTYYGYVFVETNLVRTLYYKTLVNSLKLFRTVAILSSFICSLRLKCISMKKI